MWSQRHGTKVLLSAEEHGVDKELLCKPLTLREKLTVARVAGDEDPEAQALGMAKFLVRNIVDPETGAPFFRNKAGKLAAQYIVECVDPDVTMSIFQQIAEANGTAEAEELAGKSETPESA